MRLLPGVLAALVACASGAAAATPPLVVRAHHAHLGDGRVIDDAVLVVQDGTVTFVGPASQAHPPAGAKELACDVLLPGLLAERRPAEPVDAASADASRLAIELLGPADDDALLRRGVTAVAVSPGTTRLVAGRAGVVRLLGSGSRRTVLEAGAVHASLVAAALDPPPLFEPVLRVNVDNPLPPAKEQRPSSAMGAVAELRRLLLSPAMPWIDVRSGLVPLRVRARSEAELRRAIGLARDTGASLTIEGGDEAWAVAPELAALGALVVLEPADPQEALVSELRQRADTAAVLASQGVRVALSSPLDARPDPLLLAASAVRAGLPHDAALAAVTGRLAEAAGASGVGRLVAGGPADFAGFAEDPLEASALPAFVVAAGRVLRDEPRDARDDAVLLAVRVARAFTPDRVIEPATILVRGDRIASVTAGDAVPAGARVIDLGAESVAVPGFIDAFSRVGLEPGSAPGGNPRLRASDALEPGHASLERGLTAGVTTALAMPATRGAVLGMASVVGLAPRRTEPRHDADAPEEAADGRAIVDVLAADAGLVFWLDDGPSDAAPRQQRLKGLRELIQRAKTYHDTWTRAEKKPDESKGKKKPRKNEKEAEKPEKDPQLEPFRAMFAGRVRAYLRSGREDLMIAGIDALKGAGVTPVLCGGEEADLVASDLASREVNVILPPRPLRRDGDRVVNVAAELRAKGVPVAFGSFGYGATERLPVSVAGLVREGLGAEDALLGLTSVAARVAGQEAALGKLAAGARGDLVVWDGDPMEPSSRVKLVVARGRVAWPAELVEEAP